MGLRSLVNGQVVVFLASFLSLSASLLIPVSAGAILLDLRGEGCKIGGLSASNCAYVLSVSPIVSKATIGILVVMILTTILLVTIVSRWRLGVYTNPWSMCTLASLCADPNIRQLILDASTEPDKKQARIQLEHQGFRLDHLRNAEGNVEYGIVTLDRFCINKGRSSAYDYQNTLPNSRLKGHAVSKKKRGSQFIMLGIIGKLCLFFILSGVLVLVLYYARTSGDTAFELFIDSDSFGVQFLFTSLGVIICLSWSSFLGAVAVMTPYQMLAEKPRKACQSILLAPPTNAFSGLWYAVRTRRVFLGLVSLVSILSESLGVFLGNIPFKVTQTFFVFQICTWTAVGIMSLMVLILLGSFFVRWPDMPVNPSTIAGAMYYVCDTSLVEKFEGLSTLSRMQRDITVTNMALLYEFNEMVNILVSEEAATEQIDGLAIAT
ncbi:hypothetical protein F5Y10DRAFT_288177 [Nemania abortiva]|nr:hypothetical protein F5Y10DRAFT_288177 [Nemania abortiva]